MPMPPMPIKKQPRQPFRQGCFQLNRYGCSHHAVSIFCLYKHFNISLATLSSASFTQYLLILLLNFCCNSSSFASTVIDEKAWLVSHCLSPSSPHRGRPGILHLPFDDLLLQMDKAQTQQVFRQHTIPRQSLHLL